MNPPRRGIALLVVIAMAGYGSVEAAGADSDPAGLGRLQAQINQIRNDETTERRQLKSDEDLIEDLEQQIKQMKADQARLSGHTRELELSNQKLTTDTAQRVQQLQDQQEQISKKFPPELFDSAINRYLGTHQFTWNGAVAGSFIYDRGNNTNTFALTFEPLVIYRLNDWISFEGELEAALPEGSEAKFGLPIAMFQLFLNDYLQVNAGLFDQPFGDWYEAQSTKWVNRFITAPLLYGAEAIVPPTELGVQLRGGLQWGQLGQDFDYTTWVGNGPGFDSSLPQPVVGQTLNPVNNIQVKTNGKAFGTRLRFYPFPLDSNLGRLELGASTYDGKWLNGHWFNSWGIDFAYLKGDLQTRGEYVQTYRQMPPGFGADNRQGWYVQLGYFLQHMPLPNLPFGIADQIHKVELLTRYSGVNQRAIVADEITASPELAFSGSPSLFSPHAREVALGLDYWIEPSIVWQTEFDMELPHAGGTLFSFNGANTPTATPFGASPNDRAILTQFVIGF
jgi:TolA-binding protein